MVPLSDCTGNERERTRTESIRFRSVRPRGRKMDAERACVYGTKLQVPGTRTSLLQLHLYLVPGRAVGGASIPWI